MYYFVISTYFICLVHVFPDHQYPIQLHRFVMFSRELRYARCAVGSLASTNPLMASVWPWPGRKTSCKLHFLVKKCSVHKYIPMYYITTNTLHIRYVYISVLCKLNICIFSPQPVNDPFSACFPTFHPEPFAAPVSLYGPTVAGFDTKKRPRVWQAGNFRRCFQCWKIPKNVRSPQGLLFHFNLAPIIISSGSFQF